MAETNEVELIEVTKRYGASVAVDNISLSVYPSEFVTLLGPSGCGKTTLLRLIGGFVDPDEGRVLLAGQDVTGLPPYRRNVTTVFQQYALFPHMTVFSNVAFGLERQKTAKAEIVERVGRALEMVRLTGMDDRKPAELSGGQQQRVALARSLVLRPRVLLLDEPLAALDLKLRKQMQIELKSLQQELGLSFVYVTHDQEEALTMSDRIVVMSNGRIEQIGGATDIYERPVNRYVADFIGASNIIDGLVEQAADGATAIRAGGSLIHTDALAGRGRTFSVGQSLRIMIRPEKITLAPAEDGGPLMGRIESGQYQGNCTRWQVALDDGKLIAVLEQNQRIATSSHDRTGDRVALHWDPESAVVLEGT